jgi:hypothetical protein
MRCASAIISWNGSGKQCPDPGEELLNPIDIGTVGGKLTQFGADGFDEVFDGGHFVAGKTSRMTISP